MIYEVTLSEIYEIEALTPTDAICKAQAKQAKGEFGNYSTAKGEFGNYSTAKGEFGNYSTANAKATKSGYWIVDNNALSVSCSNCGVEYHPSDLGIISDDSDRVPYCPRCGSRNEGKIR